MAARRFNAGPRPLPRRAGTDSTTTRWDSMPTRPTTATTLILLLPLCARTPITRANESGTLRPRSPLGSSASSSTSTRTGSLPGISRCVYRLAHVVFLESLLADACSQVPHVLIACGLHHLTPLDQQFHGTSAVESKRAVLLTEQVSHRSPVTIPRQRCSTPSSFAGTPSYRSSAAVCVCYCAVCGGRTKLFVERAANDRSPLATFRHPYVGVH